MVTSGESQIDLVSTPSGGQVHEGTERDTAKVDQPGVLMGPHVLGLQDGSESQGLSDGNSKDDGRSTKGPKDGGVKQSESHILVYRENEFKVADLERRESSEGFGISHGIGRTVVIIETPVVKGYLASF